MASQEEVNDLVIIGAGPSGLACAIAAHENGLQYVLLDKGCLVNAIFNFPPNLIFFSTADLLEIGRVPLIISDEKPTRTDLLKYYRLVSEHYGLNIKLFHNVLAVAGDHPRFVINVEDRPNLVAKNVVIATGQYDRPNLLGIPGEDLDKVSHYYTEPHSFYKKKVAIIGGKNSAVEFALDLYKNSVDVTLIHRGETFGKSVKYWIRPDIENRVKEGKIKAIFNATVKEIRPGSIVVADSDGEQVLENDFVFAMTGYHPDTDFLQQMGVVIGERHTPKHDPETLETNVRGIYVAGVVTVGSEGSKVFIENSRAHGNQIIGHILNGRQD